jgi:broad specificity phosphatase PhoE
VVAPTTPRIDDLACVAPAPTRRGCRFVMELAYRPAFLGPRVPRSTYFPMGSVGSEIVDACCSQRTARVTLIGPVERLIVARHAESEYNVQGLISADPSSHRSPLTSRGIQQARSLADRLAGDEIDLCVTSGTLRAVQTAEIVATALSIPLMTTPLLNDPSAGVFEDGPVEAFVRWMSGCDADTLVPGTTMSLRDSARRYFEAARLLLRRPERTVLVVAHAPALRWIVQAAQGRTDPLDYSSPLFAHADPAEVDVRALRSSMDQLVADPFVVFSGRGNR